MKVLARGMCVGMIVGSLFFVPIFLRADDPPAEPEYVHDDAARKSLIRTAELYEVVSWVLGVGAVVDTVLCGASVFTEGFTTSVFFVLHPCPEAIAAAALSWLAYNQAQENRDKAAQQAEGLPGFVKCEWDPEVLEACQTKAKYVAVTWDHDNCTCPSRGPPNINLDNFPTLPSDVKAGFESLNDMILNGDVPAIEEYVENAFGDFAHTDVGDLQTLLDNAMVALPPEMHDMVEDIIGAGEDVMVDIGDAPAPRTPAVPISPVTPGEDVATRLLPADKRQLRDEWKEKAKDRESGISGYEKGDVFVIVHRRYQQQEELEFRGSLLTNEARGVYTEIKYIPDEAAVKEVLETISKEPAPRTLGEELERRGE